VMELVTIQSARSQLVQVSCMCVTGIREKINKNSFTRGPLVRSCSVRLT